MKHMQRMKDKQRVRIDDNERSMSLDVKVIVSIKLYYN